MTQAFINDKHRRNQFHVYRLLFLREHWVGQSEAEGVTVSGKQWVVLSDIQSYFPLSIVPSKCCVVALGHSESNGTDRSVNQHDVSGTIEILQGNDTAYVDLDIWLQGYCDNVLVPIASGPWGALTNIFDLKARFAHVDVTARLLIHSLSCSVTFAVHRQNFTSKTSAVRRHCCHLDPVVKVGGNVSILKLKHNRIFFVGVELGAFCQSHRKTLALHVPRCHSRVVAHACKQITMV